MNNEIGRKLTSLTLMTIMVAGGLTFAIPGVMPAAHAQSNANLFVSAENSQFDNYMSGPQVIEVVIIDPDIDDTDEGKGEPDVTINGNDMRMVQAVDGNWYGYFADRTMAQTASQTVNDNIAAGFGAPGDGLDFGTFCDNDSVGLAGGGALPAPSFSTTVGVAVSGDVTGGVNGTTTIEGSTTCSAVAPDTAGTQNVHVVRESKDVNTNVALAGNDGQINIDVDAWPFIQLYDLNPTGNVIVQYNKGGGVQSVTLTFDTVDQYANTELDRSKYPPNAQVHVTLTDLWLNIDPTDEDSWTFGTNATNGTTTIYQVFTENGGDDADAGTLSGDIQDDLPNLMIEDNGILIINPDEQGTGTPIINLFDNDDQALNADDGGDPVADVNGDGVINAADAATTGGHALLGPFNKQPVTMTELSANSGIFSNYDESDQANIRITGDALRGTSATVDYNETPASVVVGFEYATIDIQPVDDEWSSGEEIPVVLIDADANRNTRADEDLDLFDPTVDLIPALSTGDPFTLCESGDDISGVMINATWLGAGSAAPAGGTVNKSLTVAAPVSSFTVSDCEAFSDRAIFDVTGPFATFGPVIDLATTAGELRDSIEDPFNTDAGPVEFSGINLFNYDIRSWANNTIVSAGGTTGIFLLANTAGTGDGSINTDPAGTVNVPLTAVNIANVTTNAGLVSLNSTSAEVADPTTIHAALFGNLAGGAAANIADGDAIGIFFDLPTAATIAGTELPMVADFFTFGFEDDGLQSAERVANQIIRIEAEETGDNTSTFEGSLEYVMVNQLNILDEDTYTGLSTIADDPSFIVIEDLTDEDSPRVNYFDVDLSGVPTATSDQEEAPSHSGVVSFDMSSYKVGDTVFITLEDLDLNVDSDLIEIYTMVSPGTALAPILDPAVETIGEAGLPVFPNQPGAGALGRLLDVTFDDELWAASFLDLGAPFTGAADCAVGDPFDDGLFDTDFTLVETGAETGVFTGDFLVPGTYCSRNAGGVAGGTLVSVTGTDIEVNYVDFRDASGEVIEVGDSAGIRANTGSVSLDRTVYPVPWGDIADTAGGAGTMAIDSAGLSIFPIHATGIATNAVGPGADDIVDGTEDTLGNGDLTIHVRVNDPDFDISPTGEDVIALLSDTGGAVGVGDEVAGPVKITVSRGADSLVLATAGGPAPVDGLITTGSTVNNLFTVETVVTDPTIPVVPFNTRELGPITEIAPDAGIFELDFVIRYTDGPQDPICPVTGTFTASDGTAGIAVGNRFDTPLAAGENYCVKQGDIITVEYTDPTDASGDPNTVTDSATFDLRNGVLQSDKSVYIIGADMIMTVIEPDWDLDNDSAETYDLDVVEWDSDAATVTMGDQGGEAASFDPEPSNFRETGDSTGIFQIVIEIPEELNGDRLERGEEVVLEYTDWGPSGSDFVGDEDEDVNLTIFTSNFGATVELDQKVYTWTDKVYITIVAPDHNFDSDLIDEIGESATDPIKVATRGNDIDKYKLVETGTDTGIFTGEVILTGFPHDADGDSTTGDASGFDAKVTGPSGVGPTDGFLPADDDDGITVSFEFSEDETVVGSALIRWNIGEVQWLEASYPASGTGVVRVVDPDLNLNPEAVDNFDVDVWSDSDAGGIDLTVTETNEATGIFEGTVFFTTTDESSGHRLRVSEGDTITAEYEDNTLPDPYTTADELDITGTSIIGTVVPPLERAPAANARVVDAFGNSLAEVQVDQQVQITADLANGQDREQSFAYLVQIQDSQGVTVSLAWITGSLAPGQSFSPALSWIPNAPGVYTATVFVWQSVDNPTALSPPVTVDIRVV